MKQIALVIPFIAAISTMAQADGLDFTGNLSMGLQSTTINGETDIMPFTRIQGVASYSMETDNGVTFVLALEFDRSSIPSSELEFLPGHR